MNNDFKASGCETPKTPLSAIGIDDPRKLVVSYDPNFSWEDKTRLTIECDEITFLTDCAKINLKRDDLSRYIDKTKRIVINGVSFVKEDESGDGE